MFRIAYFVEDKHLADVLKSLTGKALNLEVHHVVNASAAANGKVAAVSKGDRLQMAIDEIDRLNLKVLSSNIIRELLSNLGLNPNSYSYYLQGMIKRGRIKKTGKGNRSGYTVVST